MANEFMVARVAYGTYSFPANAVGVSDSTLAVTVPGVYIPTGAIITGITHIPIGALTAMGSMGDGTMNVMVGAQALGTADAKASVALLAGSAYKQTVVGGGIGAGPIVSTGGPLWINFASSLIGRSDVSANLGVYVGSMQVCNNMEVKYLIKKNIN